MPKILQNRSIQISLALILVTLAVYWQVGKNEFVDFDDGIYITKNPNVQHALNTQSIAWAFTSGYALNWHPLTWISHMVDYQLYGLNPSGHHLTSLIFHVVNSVLLYWVLKRMTGAMWQSAFVAAIFALHPLHVESVAWAAERKDVLSTFFWLLTMGAYVWYVQEPKAMRYLLVFFSFALGLMAKPMLVTLPFVLLLLDYWPLGRFRIAGQSQEGKPSPRHRRDTIAKMFLFLRLVREKLPLLVLVVGSSLATFLAQERGEAVSTLEGLPLRVRVANALVSYVNYIWKAIWPSGLAVFYPHPLDTLPLWKVAGAGLALAGSSVFFLWLGTRRPYLTVGWLWYVGTLVPVIGLLQVGQQSMADRYMYVPLIGFSIIAAWGITDLTSQLYHRRKILTAATALLLCALSVQTWLQAGYWRNNLTLFQHAVDVTSDNWLAQMNVGGALHGAGKLNEAVAHYSETLRIRPDYEQAHLNLVSALLGLGKVSEAADAHSTYGTFWGKQGKLAEATRYLSEAVRLKPDLADAHNNLGIVLALQGKMNEARDHFSEAIRLQPGHWNAHYNLGLVFAGEGRLDQAIAQYSEALRIKPDYQEARAALQKIHRP